MSPLNVKCKQTKVPRCHVTVMLAVNGPHHQITMAMTKVMDGGIILFIGFNI